MPTTLGSRLKEARKTAGMTQRQLADKIQVSNTSISNWEKGFSNPDPDTIQHLCWALNVQPNYFFSVDTPIDRKPIPDTNIIRIAGRDGSFEERQLTDQQLAALKAVLDQMPDASGDL